MAIDCEGHHAIMSDRAESDSTIEILAYYSIASCHEQRNYYGEREAIKLAIFSDHQGVSKLFQLTIPSDPVHGFPDEMVGDDVEMSE